ncbi:polysaccharide biosynthesis tyrosine autokinase [Caballeronia sp. LP006]|uniref:polysaccharide biosynthesis tyrosine autokinase n=1 Tax=Caballeronia sp. LP006 TaxID=3038552 RepID=UPI002863F0C0|nr:polysaccharide biosynthesis tyrosine autokinase [Caballeronia sp. LP006]MDR5826434.1 polysaccharide biosynthesis tyrosine autokinase [Caballeronia sp. LP006]
MKDSVATHMPDFSHERGQLSVRAMLALMRDHYKEILLVALGVTLIAVAYAFLATPQYQGDAVVRVDPTEPNALGIALQNQDAQVLMNPSPGAEMAVMTSRSVLQPVIEKYRFDVAVIPKQIPIIGSLANKLATPGRPASPWLGLSSFAWGGEQLQVASFDVPHELEEEKFTLTAGADGHYQLTGPSGELLIAGVAGKPASANGVSLDIKKIVARPGTDFTLIRYNSRDAVARFTDLLQVQDMAKDTGVIEFTFLDSNPWKAAQVTNSLVDQYIATAVAAKQRSDSATLEFINQELPRLKADLKRSELALNEYRSKAKALQPTAESQAYLQGGIELQKQYAALQMERTQLLNRFQPSSRWIVNIDDQLNDLKRAMSTLDTRFSEMPSSERQSLDLERDAKVAETIYLGMVQKSEQLSVRRASSTGGAHIVDYAITPLHQVKPNRLLVIGGGVFVGLIFGVFSVFIRKHVMTGVTDPSYIEELSVPLIGAVYFSQHQMMYSKSAAQRLALPSGSSRIPGKRSTGIAAPYRSKRRSADPFRDDHLALLAAQYPQDPAVEAIREVCSPLLNDLSHIPNKVICLTGPTPGAGKSFIAANLAAVLAEIGHRVLLIDGDMRRGRLASLFGQGNAGGLHEVLRGDRDLHSVVRSVGVDGLSFMSCGSRGANPAMLLMKTSFDDVLRDLRPLFDVIVIDTPPMLAVGDASIVATKADATLLVLRSGLQSEKEISETVKKLERSDARVLGAVFNAIPIRRSDKSYSYIMADTAAAAQPG